MSKKRSRPSTTKVSRSKMSSSAVRACTVRTSQRGPFQLTPEQCAKFRPGKKLGQGAYAVVYDRRGDPTRVAKFTTDEKDADANALLIGKKYRHLVRVDDVRRLRGNERVFGIISERLKTGGGYTPDDSAINILRQILTDYDYYRTRGEIDPDEPMSSVLTEDAYKLCKYREPNTPWEQRRPPEQANRCKSHLKQMVTALDEALDAGMITRDLHQGNWGMRGNDHVILDFGHSTKFHKAAPVINLAALAGLRRSRKKRK